MDLLCYDDIKYLFFEEENECNICYDYFFENLELNQSSSGSKVFFDFFRGQTPLMEGENRFLDPLLWSLASLYPHIVKPVFCVDSENVCFQELNRSSSRSKIGFVGKWPKMYIFKLL